MAEGAGSHNLRPRLTTKQDPDNVSRFSRETAAMSTGLPRRSSARAHSMDRRAAKNPMKALKQLVTSISTHDVSGSSSETSRPTSRHSDRGDDYAVLPSHRADSDDEDLSLIHI